MKPNPGASRGARVLIAVLVAAAVAATAFVAARQAAREQRLLGVLDGVIGHLRTAHAFLIPWLEAHAIQVAGAITGTIVLLILLAWWSAGRRVVPIAWFGFSLSAAVWGETLLLSDRLPEGLALLALGAGSALLLGVWFPLPERPFAGGGEASATSSAPIDAFPVWEIGLVGVLTVGTFITRVYALTELPGSFETEMILSMLASHSTAGVLQYSPWGMLSTSNGIGHLFSQLLSFDLLGTSVFSLRLTSAFWWTLSVPLFYWLLRRIGGVSAAVIGTLLLICAPEQVYWSRCETTCIALLTPLAIITIALTLLLVETGRGWVLAAFLLWLPFSRLFYTPVIVLPLYAIFLCVHSLVFVRAYFRTFLRVSPIILAACVLWLYSLSAAFTALTGEWQFLTPVQSGGAGVWRGEGAWRSEDLPGLVTAQVANLSRNLQTVGAAWTYRGSFNQWYARSDPSRHPTTANVGYTVLVVLGIGYLLGQIRSRRAFLLLIWVGFGILPSVLSLEPVPRRMGLAFSGFYAIAAVTLASALHFFRSRTAPWVTWVARAACGLGLSTIVLTSIGSHFALPTRTTYLDEVRRVSAPAFSGRDAVLHTLPPNWSEILSFVHGDEVYRDGKAVCTRTVSGREFLPAAVRQSCNFEANIFRFNLWPEERLTLGAAYDPQRVSFLVSDGPVAAPHRALLEALFPRASSLWLRVPNTIFNMLWVPVDRSMLDEVQSPALVSALPAAESAPLAAGFLRGVRLSPTQVEDYAGIAVEGGLLIESDGWYSIALDPQCPEASLTLDGKAVAAAAVYPFTKGVRALKLQLPSATACALPLQLKAQRYERKRMLDVPSPALVSPRVAALPAARGRGLVSGAGFQEVPFPFTPGGEMLDVGIDASGLLALLSRDGDKIRLAWVRSDGTEASSWQLDAGAPTGMSVAPDGTIFLVYPDRVGVHRRDGSPIATWGESTARTHNLGHLANGQVLSPMMEHNFVNRLDRRGNVLQTWRVFEGEPGYFRDPVAVYVGREGDIVVLQTNSMVLWFRTPADRFEPTFMGSFSVEFLNPSVLGLGGTFDEKGRLIVPDPQVADIFTYELDGDRAMTADAAVDLANAVGDPARRVVSADHGIYVFDAPRRLRKFERVSDASQN